MSEKTTDGPIGDDAGFAEAKNIDTGDSEFGTLKIPSNVAEEEFFRWDEGPREKTIARKRDLEAQIPNSEYSMLRPEELYWVNKPFAYVAIYTDETTGEYRYYSVEPALTTSERDLVNFLKDKVQQTMNFDEMTMEETRNERANRLKNEVTQLLERYSLTSKAQLKENPSIIDRASDYLLRSWLTRTAVEDAPSGEESTTAIPTDEEGKSMTLNEEQIYKAIYYIIRDNIRFGKIDAIKHDTNVEDISCDGYRVPIFVYHTNYEQIRTNIYYPDDQELDDFVIKLAQEAGKGISKRQPQVDAQLPDGSRAQLTLGEEVSGKGTNFTIRQFKEAPFTPVDLIKWNTYDIDQMTYLWLAIENGKSMIVGGGTASGKTTTLNGVSLFIPGNKKIVSIEDTRELEIPQLNWVASITRPSFSEDGAGGVDEYDLLEAALRQRPDYIVMGEVRGDEGQDLFQVMSTGHTSYTTFHASSVDEVFKRFTTDPINVAESMFSTLDLISVQIQTRVDGRKVRRNKIMAEVSGYSDEDGLETKAVFRFQKATDEIRERESGLLKEIAEEDLGWDMGRLEQERLRRRLVLAYMTVNGIKSYRGVAATLQAYMVEPEAILSLVARGELEDRVSSLKNLGNIHIGIDEETEAQVPRPTLDESDPLYQELQEFLNAHDDLLSDYADREVRFGETLETVRRKMQEQTTDEEDVPEIPPKVEQSDGAGFDLDPTDDESPSVYEGVEGIAEDAGADEGVSADDTGEAGVTATGTGATTDNDEAVPEPDLTSGEDIDVDEEDSFLDDSDDPFDFGEGDESRTEASTEEGDD